MNPIIKKSRLLKLSEAAELLNVHPNTLRHWDKKDILKAVRFGQRRDRRYQKSDIERFLKGHK